MNAILMRLLRIPLTLSVLLAVLALAVPFLMTQYPPLLVRPGIRCIAVGETLFVNGVAVCRPLAALSPRVL